MRCASCAVLLLIAGCFSPSLDYDDGKLACDTGSTPCPPGYQCVGGRCWRHPPQESDGQAEPPDAALESFDAADEVDAEVDASIVSQPDAPVVDMPDAAAPPDAVEPPDAASSPDAPASSPDASPGAPDAAGPPILAIDPPAIDLGGVTETKTNSVMVTITNNGASRTANLTASLGPTPGPFGITSDLCTDAKLNPGGQCTLNVVFAPQSAGQQSTTLTLSDGAVMKIASVTGTGLTPGALTVTPDPANFATTASGSTSPSVKVTVRNTGGSQVMGLTTSITGTHAAQFGIDTNGCVGQALDPNTTCDVFLTFSPSGAGSRSASFAVGASTGESGSAALAGTGTARLTIDFMGTGGGQVMTTTAGLDCTADCHADLASPSVTITAAPDGSSTFDGWSGGGCSSTGMCTVSLTGDVTVTATFTLKPLCAMVTVTTLAGNGLDGFVDGTGGRNGTTKFTDPLVVTVDATGVAYVGDNGNYRVRKVAVDGTTTTLAGNGMQGNIDGTGGASGTTKFGSLWGITVDGSGNVYTGDAFNLKVRKSTATGVTTTLTGNGAGFFDGTGGPTGTTKLNEPRGLAFAGTTIYVADWYNHRIRAVSTANGSTTTLAGNGNPGAVNGTGGAGGTTTFNNPNAVAVDVSGNVYVVDNGNNLIRVVASNGSTTTLTTPALVAPNGVAVDDAGNVYITEAAKHWIRRIAPGGAADIVVGGANIMGDTDGSGCTAQLWAPRGIAVRGKKLYVVDYGVSRLKVIDLP